jgi:FkbM family methyltransferase
MYATFRRTLHTLKRTLRRENDSAFLPLLRGIVHVGANSGQERALYDSYRLPVLWIEPIPEVFATLQRNIASYPDQRAVQALVADTDGTEVNFHVASNEGASSSMLEMASHKDLWPTVGFSRSVRMTTTTLPRVVETAGLDMTRYNGLIMDTQGSELLVLQGALPLLHHFDFVKTEVADFESYKDCCQLSDLGPFMDQNGFDEFARHRFRNLDPGKAYYDVVYRRR